VEIKWSNRALNQFAEILDFIVENGFGQYAIELEDRIIDKLDALHKNQQLYPADRFKRNNNGSWYAFEVDEYRISYKQHKSHITVIRIRHTSRRPRIY
jgi:plasmid stabilization system protein ParE